MLRRLSFGSLSALLVAFACTQNTESTRTGTEITVTADGLYLLDGDHLRLESVELSDTVTIIAAGSALYTHIDSLALTLHRRGVGHVVMRSVGRDSSEAVTARLVEPQFERAVIPYNLMHITVSSDQSIHILRGESSDVRTGTLTEITAIVRMAVAQNAGLSIGLGVEPAVRFDDYLGALLLLQNSPATRTIVNAPVPGSSPSTVDWRQPDGRISIVFHEPWRELRRWEARPSREH